MSLEKARARLDDIERRYDALEAQMNDPEVASDYQRYMQLAKTKNEIEPVAVAYKQYKRTLEDVALAGEMLDASGAAERDFWQDELDAARRHRDELEEKLRLLLLPKDPNDEKNVIMEIRAAAGGEEAKLFAAELFRMYSRYAERRGWKLNVLSLQETGLGGVQDVTFEIEGKGAYSQLKYEAGVHRVQRVPVTESSGRIQTSTVTVAVLPEVDEVEVDINKNDVEEDVYHSSSAGGQNVQKVATAIRLTHKPTGLVVTCQDERSQLQNRIKAWSVLRARLYEMQQQQAMAARTGERRAQVGTGERSEKIRTYNFPDGRVTDHRVNLTIHNVPAVLDGDIQPFIDALVASDQARKLGESEEE
ncbi:MAG TPA: peptide chain release factor 1 [Chthonomonadaceae bacterium]|nr:peptide chain release factor 1 [Chthonomonadaceae bacterium]